MSYVYILCINVFMFIIVCICILYECKYVCMCDRRLQKIVPDVLNHFDNRTSESDGKTREIFTRGHRVVRRRPKPDTLIFFFCSVIFDVVDTMRRVCCV